MRRLLLIGAGHAGAELLRRWALGAPTDVELVVISPVAWAPYSGMIPSWIAGEVTWDGCCIDFADLAARASARVIVDHVVALDVDAREVTLSSGAVLGADVMVLNIGSTVHMPRGIESLAPAVLPTRPLHRLRDTVTSLVERWRGQQDGVDVVAVGGGAAGVESILALRKRLMDAGIAPRCALLTRDVDLIRGINDRARRLLVESLERAGVAVHKIFEVDRLQPGGVLARDGRAQDADVVVWAAGAVAHAWPAASGLDVDAAGFVRIDATLRSTSHPWLFAVGDCAAFSPPLPKAGVFSVRMGPVLARNVIAAFNHRPLQVYRPQRDHLVLLNTADGRAIASRGRWAAQGEWAMRWKNWIDRRFIARYRD